MKKHKKEKFKLWQLLATFTSILAMIIIYGCGGGGGGGGVPAGVSYTGVTTQAVIDETNAYDIAVGTYAGGDIASDLTVFGAVNENSNSTKSPLVFNIASNFLDVIYQIESSTIQSAGYLGAVVTESDSIAGSCGGSFSTSLTADDQTGNFNGSLAFNNFCEPDSSVNGVMTLSGNIDVTTGVINYIEMSFTNITMIAGQESISLNGSMDFNLQSSPMRMTMSFVFKDNNLNKTYKYENFVYEYTQGVGYEDMTLTGRYYDPDYGYVDIITESPLRITDTDLYPSTGTVTATGDSGTKARLSVLDSSSFIVEADTDGDGSYDDYNSDPILWSSI